VECGAPVNIEVLEFLHETPAYAPQMQTDPPKVALDALREVLESV